MSAGKACAEREAVEGDSCGAREEGIWMATGIRVRAPYTGRATDEKQKQEKKWQDSYWVGPRTPEREGRGRWRRRTKQGGRRAAGRRGGLSTGQGHPGGAAAAPLLSPDPAPHTTLLLKGLTAPRTRAARSAQERLMSFSEEE